MRLTRILIWLAIGASCGCADVQIRKVPNRSDYSSWSDEDQRRVDSMCGLRFYRRRPYVVVKKTFPVKSETFFVDGVVSADGRLARITADLSDPRFKILHAKNGATTAGDLPLRHVWKPDALSAEARSDTETVPTTGQPLPGGLARGPDSARGGINNLRQSTDLAGIAYKDLEDQFSVLYLPDFEEEYVVDARPGLGNSDVTVGKGPGDDLLSLGVAIDNSAIVGPILDAYSSLLASGAGALKTAMGLPAVEGVVVPDAKSAVEGEGEGLKSGAHVTFRVHVVSMANPGMYPVLKASEMLDHRGQVHRIREGNMCGASPCELDPATHFVPCWPYSRIAYQIHRTIIVEQLITPGETVDASARSAEEILNTAVGDPVRIARQITNCCTKHVKCEATHVIVQPEQAALKDVTHMTITLAKQVKDAQGRTTLVAWGMGEFPPFLEANNARLTKDIKRYLRLGESVTIEFKPKE